MKTLNQFFLLGVLICSGFLFLNMDTPQTTNFYDALENGIPFNKAEISIEDGSTLMLLQNKAGTTIGEIVLMKHVLNERSIENGKVTIDKDGIHINSGNNLPIDILIPTYPNKFNDNPFRSNPFNGLANNGIGISVRLMFPEDIVGGVTNVPFVLSKSIELNEPCPSLTEIQSYQWGGAGTASESHSNVENGIVSQSFIICRDGYNAAASKEKNVCIKRDCWK